MNRNLILLTVLLLLPGIATGYRGEQSTEGQEVTFEQLFSSPEQYNGRYVTWKGPISTGGESSSWQKNWNIRDMPRDIWCPGVK